MLDQFHASLEARDPAKGHFRSYQLEVGIDLLGDWIVEIRFGRIGAQGRNLRHVARDADAAKKLVGQMLRRRATAPSRIGTGYRLLSVFDPHHWLSEHVPVAFTVAPSQSIA
jgi:predicted DNA-binding WGR domain protein